MHLTHARKQAVAEISKYIIFCGGNWIINTPVLTKEKAIQQIRLNSAE